MRDANPAQISTQAINDKSMFHNQLMIQSQADVGLNPAKQVLINRFMEDGTDKIVFQGLLKDVLLMSLGEILLNKEFKQMKWGSAFADLWFRKKVKLINCPAGMKPIGPREGITGSALVPLQYLKTIVKDHI
ncbi:hypothetical protein F5880DRAFT_1618279 [Lentinula raphanica]|nr:hypothetical protein F5880DRAFT_1618279 [Lentinula raphanica]